MDSSSSSSQHSPVRPHSLRHILSAQPSSSLPSTSFPAMRPIKSEPLSSQNIPVMQQLPVSRPSKAFVTDQSLQQALAGKISDKFHDDNVAKPSIGCNDSNLEQSHAAQHISLIPLHSYTAQLPCCLPAGNKSLQTSPTRPMSQRVTGVPRPDIIVSQISPFPEAGVLHLQTSGQNTSQGTVLPFHPTIGGRPVQRGHQLQQPPFYSCSYTDEKIPSRLATQPVVVGRTVAIGSNSQGLERDTKPTLIFPLDFSKNYQQVSSVCIPVSSSVDTLMPRPEVPPLVMSSGMSAGAVHVSGPNSQKVGPSRCRSPGSSSQVTSSTDVAISGKSPGASRRRHRTSVASTSGSTSSPGRKRARRQGRRKRIELLRSGSCSSGEDLQPSASQGSVTSNRRQRRRIESSSGYLPSYMSGNDVCKVCEGQATGLHYSCMTCEGCKGFFRRTHHKELKYSCKHDNNCTIHHTVSSMCQACRLDRCLKAGMDPKCVMTKEDRARKRELVNQNRLRKQLGEEKFNSLPPEVRKRLIQDVMTSSRGEISCSVENVASSTRNIPSSVVANHPAISPSVASTTVTTAAAGDSPSKNKRVLPDIEREVIERFYQYKPNVPNLWTAISNRDLSKISIVERDFNRAGQVSLQLKPCLELNQKILNAFHLFRRQMACIDNQEVSELNPNLQSRLEHQLAAEFEKRSRAIGLKTEAKYWFNNFQKWSSRFVQFAYFLPTFQSLCYARKLSILESSSLHYFCYQLVRACTLFLPKYYENKIEDSSGTFLEFPFRLAKRLREINLDGEGHILLLACILQRIALVDPLEGESVTELNNFQSSIDKIMECYFLPRISDYDKYHSASRYLSFQRWWEDFDKLCKKDLGITLLTKMSRNANDFPDFLCNIYGFQHCRFDVFTHPDLNRIDLQEEVGKNARRNEPMETLESTLGTLDATLFNRIQSVLQSSSEAPLPNVDDITAYFGKDIEAFLAGSPINPDMDPP